MMMLLILNWLMQSDLPEIYGQIFNEKTLGSVLMIVGAVKLIRNPLMEKGKGFLAFVITMVVSLAYGVIQFGFLDGAGAIYGLLIGALATSSFYISKNIGKILQLFAKKDGQVDAAGLAEFLQRNQSLISGALRIVRYILFRK